MCSVIVKLDGCEDAAVLFLGDPLSWWEDKCWRGRVRFRGLVVFVVGGGGSGEDWWGSSFVGM